MGFSEFFDREFAILSLNAKGAAPKDSIELLLLDDSCTVG
jgi:hypothetical protein